MWVISKKDSAGFGKDGRSLLSIVSEMAFVLLTSSDDSFKKETRKVILSPSSPYP